MSDTTKIHKDKNKLPQTIGLSFALFLITMIIGFYFNDIKAPDYLGLQPFMKSEAHFKDGSVKYFDDGNFGTLTKNERVIIDIDIPDDISIPSAELYIPLYNSIINVYLDGELIYEDEFLKDDISRHYGNYIYEIPLPDDYAGRTITLDIKSIVSLPFTDFFRKPLLVKIKLRKHFQKKISKFQ